jgi:signal transduction histidine kinase
MKNHRLAFIAMMSLLPSMLLLAETGHDSIAEARARLARGENARVSVSGRVTFSSMRLGIAFVQDETGGIAYDPRTTQKPFPIPGDAVEVSGVLTRRQGLVMILRDAELFGPPKVARQELAVPRLKPISFELEEATQMRIDGLLTHVTGIVRKVIVPKADGVPMLAEVSTPSGYAVARLPWRAPQAELDSWLGKPVLLNAVLVCQGEPPLLPRDADALLLVPGKGAWVIQPEFLDEVFARKPATLSPELLVTSRSAQNRRLHIQGVVTAARPRQWLTMRVSGGSVQVMTRQTDVFEVGDLLSVACWPQNQGGRMVMLDGVCRKLSHVDPPKPVPVISGFIPAQHRPMELVTATGLLRHQHIPGGVPRYTLRLSNGETSLVQWATFLKPDEAADLPDGSTMRITGILSESRDSSIHEFGSIHAIQPRSVADLKLVRGPSWWTPARLKNAAGWLAAISVLGVGTAMVTSWQIRWQRLHIHAIEARSIAEEERRRISREFHDSLQQQLAGAALHLETLKGAIDAAPDMMPGLIDDTTAMIRHCQLEARHCIWDLRSEVGLHEDLGEAIRAWLQMRTSQPDTGAEITFEQRCELPKMDDDTSFQIMRITQEAVNNALAHAGAQKVCVVLEGTPERLSILVDDDGRGFDATQPYRGRFGLSGQRERAHKIGAQLHFTSRPGHGTRMILCVPARNTPHYALSQ